MITENMMWLGFATVVGGCILWAMVEITIAFWRR